MTIFTAILRPDGSMRVREVASILLFFGSLVGRSDLHYAAEEAIKELTTRGYQVVEPGMHIRVYPFQEKDPDTAHHAADWRPGIVRIRTELSYGSVPQVYLRHELQHQANFITCKKKPLPMWALEASSIAFSGESSSEIPDKKLIERLKRSIAIDAPLDSKNYATLVSLVSLYGWPDSPCEVSSRIAELVDGYRSVRSEPLSYVVMNAASGRIVESFGNSLSELPVGSLLKLPFAAALDSKEEAEIGKALLKSDTDYFAANISHLDKEKFKLFFQASSNTTQNAVDDLQNKTDSSRTLLGERDKAFEYPIALSLEQMALVSRAALLPTPSRFIALKQNGITEASTLYKVPSAELKDFHSIEALLKTGTVSNSQGEPLLGYIFAAWPASSPAYIAIIRKGGVQGASVPHFLKDITKRWKQRYTVKRSAVRVKLLGLLKRNEYRITFPCPKLKLDNGNLSSVCGDIQIETKASGAKPVRLMHGIIESPESAPVLITDPDSYADGVMQAEADTLQGEAQKALRAVVIWNGLHGAVIRHPDSRAMCDTTHCMVYQGDPNNTGKKYASVDTLLDLLDQLAQTQNIPWFLFSAGGENQWRKIFSSMQLAATLKENRILSIQRIRNRTGDISFHIIYDTGEETVPCEVLRTAVSLPSCPDSVGLQGDQWIMTGVGEGHSLGLSVHAAQKQAEQGMSAAQIMEKAYLR